MQAVLVPEDVSRLLAGHFRPQLPAPGGGAELLSPVDVAHLNCHATELESHIKHFREAAELRRRYDPPGYAVMSCPRELGWESEQTMRVRAPRKQISAKIARRTEAANSAVLLEFEEDIKEIFKKRRQHDLDDLHPTMPRQGFRTSNFSKGEKYSGPSRKGKTAPVSSGEELDALTDVVKDMFGL